MVGKNGNRFTVALKVTLKVEKLTLKSHEVENDIKKSVFYKMANEFTLAHIKLGILKISSYVSRMFPGG